MIRILSQIDFQPFGTVLTDREPEKHMRNSYTVSLSEGRTEVYQTNAETVLNYESGTTVLSVSNDNKTYCDFYLDRPICLTAGVYMALTSCRGSSSVRFSGSSEPRFLHSKPTQVDFSVRPQIRIPRLHTFFYQEREQGFLFPGEQHSTLELTYVDQGSMHSVADGADILLRQGDAVLYGPDQWHMQYADIGMAPRFITVSFDAEGFDISGLLNRKFRLEQKAISLLQEMLREQEQMRLGADDMILSLLVQLLVILQRSGTSTSDRIQPPCSINSENDIIRRAQQYIGTHVCEKLSVPLVADNVDVSASYLTALFHKYLQISPGEYIRRSKLQQSKQLIREGNLNLSQIAEALQYSTIHHFSRQFKDKFGITPSEYAKSVR